jgi:polyhydroxyalkanoate synthase
MNIADDDQNPRPGKKLSKSLDAIAALRHAMEQRLAEAQKQQAPQTPSPVVAPEPKPEPEEPPKAAKEQPAAAPSPPPAPEREESPGISAFQDPAEWSRIMFRIADRSQKLVEGYLRQKKEVPSLPAFDPAHILRGMAELSSRILNDPERFTEAQIALWQGYIRLWQNTMARLQGRDAPPIATPAPTDKRFKDKDWQNLWLFDFIKQSYLLTAQWAHGFIKQEAEKLDPKTAHKLDFYVDQFLDAVSPSNFWLTNPEVLRATFESGGENLIKGLENLLEDMERGHGQLRISMTDAQAFKVGENLAITPGKVIFRNRLIELIQYSPSTPEVNRTPLLIIPPWINKYYILDLQEKNSLMRYLVAQGHTVFCISWVNPDETYADTRFDDYMTEGAFAAMREVKNATGEDSINVVGYCIGGTLLASALAWLNTTPQKPEGLPKVSSATYFVTMVDFAEPGDLGVFIDEDQVRAIEERMQRQGYLDAASMATTFNLLRANDLIWSFVIHNYLLGKEPFPFDILYWNSDSTNLPAAMHSFYLRKMYMENLLSQPDGLSMNGAPIDLTSITVSSFLLATREDHIAPWRSAYMATQLYQGPVKFVLSGSGHIAGVVNPPAANKYGYWTSGPSYPKDPEAWLAAAEAHNGSWWPEWMKWLESYHGGKVPAREVKGGLEAAPGLYVLAKA